MRKHLKVAAGAALVLSLAGFGGINAAWTESVSTEVQDLSTGSGGLVLSDGTLRTTVESSATDIVPGDSITRTVTVQSNTTYELSTVALSVSATGDDELLIGTPDAAAALQMKVTRDSDSAVLYNGAAKDAAAANIGGDVLEGAGATTALTVEITFPASSDNLSKDKEAHFTYTFTGAQRAGGAQ